MSFSIKPENGLNASATNRLFSRTIHSRKIEQCGTFMEELKKYETGNGNYTDT